MQLERLLQSQGFGSRRQCRALVRAELVRVAGTVCDNPFAEFEPDAANGESVAWEGAPGLAFSVADENWHFRKHAYLLLHKPVGYECSHQPKHHPSVFGLLPPQLAVRGVQCLGRLDQDTTGLLLLSDDGQFIHRWSSGKKHTPKCYQVTLHQAVETPLVEALLQGVQLHDEPAPIAAAACVPTGSHTLDLVVREGKYHQVKRMVAAAGNRVEALHRCRVGGLALDAELAPGQWRWLEAADVAQLADHPA